MAYKQNAGRDDLTNPNISALTNGTDPKRLTRNDVNKTVYQANKTIQDVKANGIGTLKPAETLYNPDLSATMNATTLFRPRGTTAYKNAILSPNKDITEFPGGVPASFSKGEGRTPYLNSRFNLNPSRKSGIANPTEENQSLDIRTAQIGSPKADLDQYRRVNQLNHVKNNEIPDRSASITSGWDFGNGEVYPEIISGQTTSRENRVTHSKPLSTAWNPNTSIAEDTAAFAADQKPGNMGYNYDGRTIAQIDKAKDDLVSKGMLGLHPDQIRPAEKAAKRSFKVAGTLEKAFLTGSESMMNKAIAAADQTLKTDEYFRNPGNSAYKNEPDLPMNNQVTFQHAEMINNYKKASSSASKAQDTSDQLTWKAQDIAKDIANGKFSLNSNNSSNSKITANNLFKSPALITDITNGKKRFKF